MGGLIPDVLLTQHIEVDSFAMDFLRADELGHWAKQLLPSFSIVKRTAKGRLNFCQLASHPRFKVGELLAQGLTIALQRFTLRLFAANFPGLVVFCLAPRVLVDVVDCVREQNVFLLLSQI